MMIRMRIGKFLATGLTASGNSEISLIPFAVQERDWPLVPRVREGNRVAAPICRAIN